MDCSIFEGVVPSPGHVHFELYPDVSEFTKLYPTQLRFANGQLAGLPSSYDNQTMDTHFKWMLQYQIDVVSIQVNLNLTSSVQALTKKLDTLYITS